MTNRRTFLGAVGATIAAAFAALRIRRRGTKIRKPRWIGHS